MEEQTERIVALVLDQEQQILLKIKELESEWNTNRPKEAPKKPDQTSPLIRVSIVLLKKLESGITKAK
jgi:hypothetical protein